MTDNSSPPTPLHRQLEARSLIRATGFIFALLVVGGWFFWTSVSSTPLRYRTRIAIPGFQSSGLVILAYERGYFRQEGLDVSLQYRATGKDCLDLVLAGKADLAVAFETPITHALIEGHPVVILTELHRSEQNTAVVTRADRSIHSAAQLIGKKVAAVAKTNAEFHLDLFLRSNLVDANQVKLLQMPIARVVEAVVQGTVDAAALWEPYVSQALGDHPERFSLLKSSFYSEFSMVAGLRENLDGQQETSYAFLRALIRADQDFNEHEAEARAIVEAALERQKFFVSRTAWDRMDIHLGLSSTLLTMIIEEANWYRSKNKQPEIARSQIKSALQGRFLKSLAPHMVTYE